MKMDWRLIAAVAVGGALGSVARYLIGALIQDRLATALPVGTLAINIGGSLLDHVDDARPGEVAVLEISSFMLDLLAPLGIILGEFMHIG